MYFPLIAPDISMMHIAPPPPPDSPVQLPLQFAAHMSLCAVFFSISHEDFRWKDALCISLLSLC